MRVVPNWHIESYRPLLLTVLQAYNPRYVLELGIGLFSTPILKGYNYRGIENDPQWIFKIKNLYKGINITYHDLEGISHVTQKISVSQKRLDGIMEYYRDLRIPDIHPNLLFVDNYSCCRSLAINALKDRFDLVIYHDCEPGSDEINYPDINTDGFKVLYLATTHNWTGLMYKEDKDIGELVNKHIIDFKNDYKKHVGIQMSIKYSKS